VVALLLRVDSTRELSLKIAGGPDRECNRCADLKTLDLKADFKGMLGPKFVDPSVWLSLEACAVIEASRH
jgi:hypothetical protein